MKKLLLELIKITLLFSSVTVGVFFLKADPVEVKARKILDSNGYLYKELNKKERDEYMQYLRTLNKSSGESLVYKKQVANE